MGSVVFVVWMFTLVVCVVIVLVNLLRRRYQSAIRTGKTLGAILLGYLFVLVIVSLATPRRVIEAGETWRFDHWGVAVESVDVLSESKNDEATRSVAVTVRVSNDAKRAPQRARDAKVFVTDDAWRRFNVSMAGQETYEAVHSRQKPLDTRLPPESSFQTVRVFDLPKAIGEFRLVVAHGVWPGRLIIGSEDSLLHKQTFIRLHVSQ